MGANTHLAISSSSGDNAQKCPVWVIPAPGKLLIYTHQVHFISVGVHFVNINVCRFSPGCPQSYDDTPRNAGDLVAAVIVQIPVSQALRN